MNFVFFGVKKSGISVFLVSVENGAGVNKMTNMTYGQMPTTTASKIYKSKIINWNFPNIWVSRDEGLMQVNVQTN